MLQKESISHLPKCVSDLFQLFKSLLVSLGLPVPLLGVHCPPTVLVGKVNQVHLQGKVFNPKYFLQERDAFYPFGNGPKGCVGKAFAKVDNTVCFWSEVPWFRNIDLLWSTRANFRHKRDFHPFPLSTFQCFWCHSPLLPNGLHFSFCAANSEYKRAFFSKGKPTKHHHSYLHTNDDEKESRCAISHLFKKSALDTHNCQATWRLDGVSIFITFPTTNQTK